MESRISQNEINKDDIFEWSKQIINGLECLHSKEIIHGNIKPEYKLFYNKISENLWLNRNLLIEIFYSMKI